jgi:hypothetical protein
MSPYTGYTTSGGTVIRRFSLAPASVALVLLLAAPAALAKEGGYLNEKGVVTPGQVQAPPRALVGPPGSGSVFVTQPTDDGTALARIDTRDSATVQSQNVGSGFTIPTVAIDKTTSGLSADGKTLVLSRPLSGLGQRTTQFEVLNAKSLRFREPISLRGTYSFDAISPDGNLIYLIQYTSPANPSHYLVRAYDVRAGHLLHAPVIDPSEAGQPMTGRPVTRVMGPTGQWAYTLYQGSDEGPFVHALDTSGHRAVCVDLDGLNLPKNLSGSQLAMSGTGDELTITRHGDELGSIDARSFAVSPPATGGEGHGFPWVLIGVLALGAAAVVGITSRAVRRRRRLASG